MVGKQKICPIDGEFRDESVYAGCTRLKEWTRNYVSARMSKSKENVYDPFKDSMPEEEPGYRTFCPYYLRSKEAFELDGKTHFRSPARPSTLLKPGRDNIASASRKHALASALMRS
jgi:DNA excision repair protein ERCC-2